MTFNRAVNSAVSHVLSSTAARTYRDRETGNTYTLDLEYSSESPDFFTVTTWGYDRETIWIPETRATMIRLKCLLQIRMMDHPLDGPDQVALRFYLDIMHRETDPDPKASRRRRARSLAGL